jgi:hypothetical protein
VDEGSFFEALSIGPGPAIKVTWSDARTGSVDVSWLPAAALILAVHGAALAAEWVSLARD